MANEVDPDDPLDDGPHDDKARGFVPDFVRRMAWAGLGAVFMSEEGIRRLASQLKLPKEVMGTLLAQAEKTKDDLGRVVSEEVRKFLQSPRLRDELMKVVSGMTIEIKAEVRLVPDGPREEGAPAPVSVTEIKTRYRRRSRSAKDDDGAPPSP
jgi:hypothetical protein